MDVGRVYAPRVVVGVAGAVGCVDGEDDVADGRGAGIVGRVYPRVVVVVAVAVEEGIVDVRFDGAVGVVADEVRVEGACVDTGIDVEDPLFVVDAELVGRVHGVVITRVDVVGIVVAVDAGADDALVVVGRVHGLVITGTRVGVVGFARVISGTFVVAALTELLGIMLRVVVTAGMLVVAALTELGRTYRVVAAGILVVTALTELGRT